MWVFVFLGPRPLLSALGPLAPRPLVPHPGPIEFLSAVFDFLHVCVIKCSCAVLIKRNSEFPIHKH